MKEREVTEKEMDRRQFLRELSRRIGYAALGTVVGSAAIDLEKILISPNPTVWLGSEGDFTGV